MTYSLLLRDELRRKKHLTIEKLNLIFCRRAVVALSCQKDGVITELLSDMEILSASIVKRLAIDQGTFLKRE